MLRFLNLERVLLRNFEILEFRKKLAEVEARNAELIKQMMEEDVRRGAS